MSKRANVVFRFEIRGNGRDEVLVRQPLATNSDATVVTGGAVSLQSPGSMTQVSLAVGWNQLVDPAAYLPAPMARNYMALIPPPTSTTPKVLAGATTDAGVSLVPGMPLVLRLPPGAVTMYVLNAGATLEVCDYWVW